ncbi:hypothetical protein Leryth_021767 [Lithospermum erythrorhizon]|nr:hypothetical protein Leryth_021767 [Lithospermum erythrorhizon]
MFIQGLDFDPPSDKVRNTLIISAVASCFVTLVVMFVLWWNGYIGGRKSTEQEWRELGVQVGFFSLKQIKTATRHFHEENKIGEGGFGSVYKTIESSASQGELSDGTVIAVKQLSSVSNQGTREFVNEVGMISALRHPNLVNMHGCCVEGRQLLLVYEYLENNCLARALFGKGLAFLHEESIIKVVHRDIKATNVLLDKDLNPKISDFGLAKLDEEENTHISTKVAGTIGYMAPEYALWGYLTFKADVYSFGIVALEIVAGKSNMNYQSAENYVCLLDKVCGNALVLQPKEDFLELVDPRLGSNYNVEEAVRMIKVALLCTNPSPALRPTMSVVVSMLEGQMDIQETNVDSSTVNDELKFKALRQKYDELQSHYSETDSLVHASDVPYTSSSSHAKDLYPIDPYSQ